MLKSTAFSIFKAHFLGPAADLAIFDQLFFIWTGSGPDQNLVFRCQNKENSSFCTSQEYSSVSLPLILIWLWSFDQSTYGTVPVELGDVVQTLPYRPVPIITIDALDSSISARRNVWLKTVLNTFCCLQQLANRPECEQGGAQHKHRHCWRAHQVSRF